MPKSAGRLGIVEVILRSFYVYRAGKKPDLQQRLDGCMIDDCGIPGQGALGITVWPPGDDRTYKRDMGYRIEYLDGDIPEDLPYDYDVAAPDGDIRLLFWDGTDSDQEPLDFRITISAVDLGGNVGEKSDPISISDPGRSGCECHSGAPLPVWALLVMAALSIFRKRRARAR